MSVTITGGRTSVTVSDSGSSVTITGSRTGATIAEASGGGGGVTDHGALTGLADDDHSLYALADGSRGSFEAAGAVTAHAGAADPHGDRAYAAALVDDLSGVTNASQARTNLGLGTAATEATGDFATAAHNHSGVYEAVGVAAALVDDLSGVSNAAQARTNLGLGTAATTATTAYDAAGTAATAVAAAAWSPVVCQLGAYPGTPTTSGAWTITSASSAVSVWPYWAGPNTQNAYIEFTNWLWLPAGTYDLNLHGNRNTDKGIATVAFAGSTVGTADFYGASAAIYAPVATGVVVATTGFLALRITAATKNASSSGYTLRPSTLICQRTA